MSKGKIESFDLGQSKERIKQSRDIRTSLWLMVTVDEYEKAIEEIERLREENEILKYLVKEMKIPVPDGYGWVSKDGELL